MDQLKEYSAFEDRGLGAQKPEGYKMIRCHMVYNVKVDGQHNACLVAGGHLTDIPLESVYSGVVSLHSVCIIAFISEMNELRLWATDIGNAYLEAYSLRKYVLSLEVNLENSLDI